MHKANLKNRVAEGRVMDSMRAFSSALSLDFFLRSGGIFEASAELEVSVACKLRSGAKAFGIMRTRGLDLLNILDVSKVQPTGPHFSGRCWLWA